MSIAPPRPSQPDGPAVSTRLAALERALPALADHPGLSQVEQIEQVHRVARRIGQRLDLSADHTVVALAGPTGSGKSSLFNALVGLDLSAVGVRRPTTGQPHACVWGPEGAAELLDWLGVPPRLQTARESVLDADSQAELRGLVLLDLPDHDSIETVHRERVDRIVQMADMIVWVLDPQKYADAAVHLRYLEPLARHVSVVVIVLNQIDRLTPDQVELCLDDLRRLLTEDGLFGVRVLATSAVRGDGLVELREVLAGSVTGHAVAVNRISADLDGVSEGLRDVIGPEAREDVDRASVKRLCSALATAAGAPAVGEAVGRTYRTRARQATQFPLVRAAGGLRNLLRRPQHPDVADGQSSELRAHAVLSVQLESALREFADTASHGLPDSWPERIRTAALATMESLPASLEAEVAATELGGCRVRGWWRVASAVQVVALLVALAGIAWWGLARRGVLAEWFVGGLPLPLLVTGVGIVAGAAVWAVSRWLAGRIATRLRAQAEEDLQDAVTAVARAQVLVPVRAQLRAYAEVREALAQLAER